MMFGGKKDTRNSVGKLMLSRIKILKSNLDFQDNALHRVHAQYVYVE